MRAAQDDHPDVDQEERRQRADVDQLDDLAERCPRGQEGDREAMPTVSSTGVPVRGLTVAILRGNSPSRAIAKKIRVWP
jgi:hypothetical protein